MIINTQNSLIQNVYVPRMAINNVEVKPSSNVEVKVSSNEEINQFNFTVEDVKSEVLKQIRAMEGNLYLGLSNYAIEERTADLVVRHAYYKEQITQYFEGDEQTKRLDELERATDRRISYIASERADFISGMMNLQEDYLHEGGYVSQAQGSKEEYLANERLKYSAEIVDRKKIEKGIANFISEQMVAFDKAKESDSGDWNKVIETGGKGIEQHIRNVSEGFGKMDFNSESNLKELGFKEIMTLSETLLTMRKGIYIEGSSSLVLVELGLAKARLDLTLEYKEMPEYLRSVISEQMDKATKIKRRNEILGDIRFDEMRIYWADNAFRNQNGLDLLPIESMREKLSNDNVKLEKESKKILEFSSEFENLAKVKSDIFVGTFLTLMDKFTQYLKDTYKPVDPGNEPIARATRFRQQLRDSMVNDWNEFASNLFSDNEKLKNDYTVPSRSGELIDVTV